MKVVCPSTPIDAYGLMIAAIKSNDPVLFLKPKALLRSKGAELIPGEPDDEKLLHGMIDAPLGDRTKWKAAWPKLTDYTVEIGKAKILTAARTQPLSRTAPHGPDLPRCRAQVCELKVAVALRSSI